MSKQNDSSTDLYKILELDKDCNLEDIKRQYLKLALIYHPDKPEGDIKRFKEINLAYKVLSNRTRRKDYDESLAATVEELRNRTEREVTYNYSDEFNKVDERGNKTFDREAFAIAFEAKRLGEERAEMDQLHKDVTERQRTAPKTLQELLSHRDQDLQECKKSQMILDPNRFDASIFNQMFNEMKSKRTELSPISEEISPTDVSGTHSSVSGANWSTVFDPNDNILRNISKNEYKSDSRIIYTREQQNKESLDDKLAAMIADLERNKNIDRSQYRMDPNMILNSLGDSDLFKEDLRGLETARGQKK